LQPDPAIADPNTADDPQGATRPRNLSAGGSGLSWRSAQDDALRHG
jgi:hypothetical protein